MLGTEGDDFTARGWSGMVGDTSSGLIFGGRDVGIGRFNEFIRYIVGNGAVKTKILNNRGSIPPMSNMAMVGTKEAGLIYGGHLSNGDMNQNAYRYDVQDDDVHITQMARCTNFFPRWQGGLYGGDINSGFIYGGPFGNDEAYKYAVEG